MAMGKLDHNFIVFVHVVQYFLNLLRTIQNVNRLTVSSILSGCFINLKNIEPHER